MTALRWWLYGASTIGLLYAVFVVDRVFQEHPIPPQLNTILWMTLCVATAVPASVMLMRSHVDSRFNELRESIAERLDAADGDHAHHGRRLDEITDGIPKIATAADIKRLIGLVEASDRDRDLQVAGLQSAVTKARTDAATELQASMRYVLDKFRENGISP